MLVRIAIGVLVLWLLWRLYTALTASGKTSAADTDDEWTEVLEAIDELPETTETRERETQPKLLLPKRQQEDNEPPSVDNLETVMVRESEAALSRIRESDEMEQLAAYHEITTYEKLSQISACEISELTRKKIAHLRQQAWEIMHPDEKD